MPLLNDDSLDETTLPGSHYGYSAARIDTLGATEYTLASVICDVSGSTGSFKARMEHAIKAIVRACRFSPRADNLLVRLVEFSDDVVEIHGFKPLESINENDYADVLTIKGATALFDASANAILATSHYGDHLATNDFAANGIVFVITDGCDNHSSLDASAVRDALTRALSRESLESLVSVLVGVNVKDAAVSHALMEFYRDAGFTQYVELEDATDKTLARLADFVSRSIAVQSRALGTGCTSKALVF